MRKLGIAIAVLLVMPCLTAGAKPFYKSWSWWAGRAIDAAATIGDGLSTQAYAVACPACTDTSIFLPGHPTTGKTIGWGFAKFGLSTGVSILAYHLTGNDPSPAWRAISVWPWAVGSAIGETFISTIPNYRLAHDCRTARLSCQ